MAERRISKEFRDFKKNPTEICSVNIPDPNNMYHWEAIIIGPNGTPYERGMFRLNITFTQEYPIKPPKIKFITKVYHPNIYEGGSICLDILSDRWSPVLTISKVLLSICSLLNEPNPNSPASGKAADIYLNDRSRYDEIVRTYTRKYAN
jgi:ubiquitin-conjugating enzyme E2 D/E